MKYIFILITLFYLSFQKNDKFTLLPFNLFDSEMFVNDFTPFGRGRIPIFEIRNAPRNTKSFAFTIEENDAFGDVWYHLILKNINKNVFRIKNENDGESIQNSWGNNKYQQRLTPVRGTHYYHFILYALDIESISARNVEEFEKSIKYHIIDKAEITKGFKKRELKKLKESKFELLSFSFKNNEIINDDYNPFRMGQFPFFRLKNAPRNTKSFAFTIEEYVAPNDVWYHLILTNIDKNIHSFRNENVGDSIQNSWGNNEYNQYSKPPSGTHYYHFILYALDIFTIRARNIKEFEESIKHHIIDKAEITGVFKHQDFFNFN